MPFQAQVEFLAQRVERPVYYASSAGRNAAHEIDQPMNRVWVDVEDGRGRDGDAGTREFGMHASGFDLLEFPTRVTSFLDADAISDVYEGEIDAFLKSLTGCSRVHIFDHTVRASDPDLREQKQVREPAYLVHNDYTSNSGFVCLRENLGDEAEELLRTPSPDGKGIANSILRIGQSCFMISQARGQFEGMRASQYLYVADVDHFYRRALQAGAQSEFEPADMDYGDRQAGVVDPNGNYWWISTRLTAENYW